MSKLSVIPVDQEITFGKEEIIVSKTDLKGRLTYANDVFCTVAEMTTREVIGQPHNIIRHPDMPRAIFKLLWDTIQSGSELFAYVKNISKTGKYYWVFAHVTPSFGRDGKVNGYHSNRRYPSGKNVKEISGLYQRLLSEEKNHKNAREGLEASQRLLNVIMGEKEKSYPEYIWSMGE